ncbi:MAG: hypothetical protein CMJ31_09435 [Phycisphaerae bacterium]|nr:hypothetical protein [Phycisphaerae bacterium]
MALSIAATAAGGIDLQIGVHHGSSAAEIGVSGSIEVGSFQGDERELSRVFLADLQPVLLIDTDDRRLTGMFELHGTARVVNARTGLASLIEFAVLDADNIGDQDDIELRLASTLAVRSGDTLSFVGISDIDLAINHFGLGPFNATDFIPGQATLSSLTLFDERSAISSIGAPAAGVVRVIAMPGPSTAAALFAFAGVGVARRTRPSRR